MNHVITDKLNILRCPACKGRELTPNEEFLECDNCKSQYPLYGNMISMMPVHSDGMIQKFWGSFFERRFKDYNISKEKYNELLMPFIDFLEDKEHLYIKELNHKKLVDKMILEIGCGSGAHASLIKKQGADIVAVDIAEERVKATAQNLNYVSEGTGIAMQADAQTLPFVDNSFDIVCSSGVLHHASDTNACIREVYRVLKKGGEAVIMLYARRSVACWLYAYPKGILNGIWSGRIFKCPEEEWLGYVTEGGPISDTIFNPYTRYYSRKQIKRLFSDFNKLRIRQSGFRFHDVPKIGKYIYWLLKRIYNLKNLECGLLSSGILVNQISPIEKRFGKYIGNCLNIKAVK